MSAKEYPDHLNPFDDNYTPVVEPLATNSRQKYNTWSAPRTHKVSTLSRVRPSFLEKPWAALNIPPKGKLVRRLSILKTAVERFTTKSKRLSHSASLTETDLPSRSPASQIVHDDYSFRIISPKVKEKIRQQVFSKSINNQVQAEDNTPDDPGSAQLNGRLSPPNPATEETTKPEELCPASPESEKELVLGPRPKPRKKRPPPPPPVDVPKVTNIALQIVEDDDQLLKSEDSQSVNSSITQDLEKDATSEDENSKTELHDISVKKTVLNV